MCRRRMAEGEMEEGGMAEGGQKRACRRGRFFHVIILYGVSFKTFLSDKDLAADCAFTIKRFDL